MNIKKTVLTAFIPILLGIGIYVATQNSSIKQSVQAEAVAPLALLPTTPTPALAATEFIQPVMTTAEAPVHISIPSLNIDANVLRVGLTKTGNMDTPHNFEDTGWYQNGTYPGQNGSSVIAGHYESGPGNNGISVPGVFQNLNKIRPGDNIYVTTEKGTKLHFVVTDTTTYDKGATTNSIFNQNDGPRLKLITCTGTWLPSQKTFAERLVVNALLSDISQS